MGRDFIGRNHKRRTKELFHFRSKGKGEKRVLPFFLSFLPPTERRGRSSISVWLNEQRCLRYAVIYRAFTRLLHEFMPRYLGGENEYTYFWPRYYTVTRPRGENVCVWEREILFLQIFHACRLAFRLREDRLRVISTAKSSAKWTRQLLFRSNERTNWRNVETNRWNQRVDLWNRVASDKARSSMRRNNRGRTVVDSGRTEWNHDTCRRFITRWNRSTQDPYIYKDISNIIPELLSTNISSRFEGIEILIIEKKK